MVFLEYDVDAEFPTRFSIWWAAFNDYSATLPLVMVDSGHQITNGYENFYTVYKGMVEASLLRPPGAALEASVWRENNQAKFYVYVQNLTGITLSTSLNSATLHGLVYEDIHAGVTDRYVRAAVSTSIDNLEPNASATFTFETPDLLGVNWDNLHYLVLVDYIPPGSGGAHDMLQAARAIPVTDPFAIQPDQLSFFIDPSDTPNPTKLLAIQGASFLSWLAMEDIAWLSVTPPNGSIETPPAVSINTSLLSPGVQQGVITFTTMDGYFTKDVPVFVYYGSIKHHYLPVIGR